MLPWEPLFTIERAKQPEVTQYGLIVLTQGHTSPWLHVGHADQLLWSRSLLKPFLLLANLPILTAAYPQLSGAHYALMMSSQQGTVEQRATLESMLKLLPVSAQDLRCPAMYPLDPLQANALQQNGYPPSPLYHPCAGKHLGILLTMQAEALDLNDYLNPEQAYHRRFLLLLGTMLDKPVESFELAVDSCGAACIGLGAHDLARLFNYLAKSQSGDTHAASVQRWMKEYALLIGGPGRLDTRILLGELTDGVDEILIAKEGADGLLALGLSPSEKYPAGLGLLIKLAGGYQPQAMETTLTFLLEQLGLKTVIRSFAAAKSEVETRFHFHLPKLQSV